MQNDRLCNSRLFGTYTDGIKYIKCVHFCCGWNTHQYGTTASFKCMQPEPAELSRGLFYKRIACLGNIGDARSARIIRGLSTARTVASRWRCGHKSRLIHPILLRVSVDSRPIRCPSVLDSSMSRCGHQPRPSSSSSSSAAAAASVRYREADETALRACSRSSIPASRLYTELRVAYVYSLPIHGQSWRRRNRSEQYSLPVYSSSPEPAHVIRAMRQRRN